MHAYSGRRGWRRREHAPGKESTPACTIFLLDKADLVILVQYTDHKTEIQRGEGTYLCNEVEKMYC